jgi:hypothetical protein
MGIKFCLKKLNIFQIKLKNRTFIVSLEFVKRLIKLLNVINPLKAELNPICHLLALVGARHFVHVSRVRVKVTGFTKMQVRTKDYFNCNIEKEEKNVSFI